MDFLSQRPLYSTDPSTKGFDLSSGKIWIYPENYPLREYQFQIVKSALYHNTLVCLPTGLGKTFVAAVVMYNFWRWYPQGKIVFLAPTKPLVAQQINACHDIMGIPSTETIELTGTTDQKKRRVAWVEHRVIFATPQVFQKDLEKNIVPSDLVKCVVVDEAHKALGKHSYCESIRLLCEQNQYFRILALSATPGGKLDAVQEVVRNLHITHMELRDDRSPDIIPYINERKLDIVLIGLGPELEGFKDRYIIIMDRHVRVLVENNVLRGFAANISKGRIFHIQKEWQQKANRGNNHGNIMKTLTILMTMYHAYELMVRHGLRAFYNFYQNHLDKFWLNDEKELLRLLEEINYYLGPFPDVRPMPDGTVPEIPEGIRFGHNKFQKLKDLLLRHFQSFEDKEEDTRAIVFVEYRDIVNEVYVLLLQSRPLIRPQKFVGQAGQKQKQQKLALENFRSNKVNVLISTSVGEEGLDVGEVDLIVCFDISQQSPIRLVQRMGRTGRKRDGHIIVLVTDGKEHQTLKSTMSRRDSLNNKVLHSSGIINALHEESPRMVPANFDPECQKMVMTVVPKTAPVKGKGKKKEPKKPRKRLDANSKTKNSKFAEPSTSSKPGGSQSSLMRFFKKPTDDPQMEVDDDFMTRALNHTEIPSLSVQTIRESQSSQQSLKHGNTIKLSEVRLLSSDDAAVEFLTLCTLKKSENEQTYIDKTWTNPYLPVYYTNTDGNNNFFDFEVPDLKILDCLKNITDCVLPPTINQNDDDMICEPSNRFNYFPITSQNDIYEEHSKFEAILDESSSDSDVTVFQSKEAKNKDSPTNEQVDWGENIDGLGFEDLLDEWSEESRMSVEKNEPKDNNKPNEIPGQSAINILNEPSMFEDILDCSTDESDTDCNQQIRNITSKSPEDKSITKNPSDQNENVKSKILDVKATTKNSSEITLDNEFKGTFEDILISSSESESDFNLQNINANSKILEEKSTTKNPSEMTIDDEFKGTFEDILNSSSESESDVNLQNINANSKILEEKSTTKNPSEMTIDDELKGTFEDILNSSSESESDINLQNVNADSKILEEKSTTKNPSEMTIDDELKGTFEDILNSSSESETDVNLPNVNAKSKSLKEKPITKNTVEMPIVDELKGIFEDILNSSSESETDVNLPNVNAKSKTPEEKSTTKNSLEMPIDDEFKGTFEDILNFSSESETDVNLQNINAQSKTPEEKSTTKNNLKMPINDEFKGTFEEILISSSESETDFDLDNITTESKNLEKKVATEKNSQIVINETKGAFEAILDTSSDESETDCSLELEPDVPFASNKILASKNSSKILIDRRSSDSLQVSKQIRTSRISGDIEINESTDLLPDCEPNAISQHSTGQNDRRNFKINSNSRESPSSDSPKNSTVLPCTELTVSQTLREVERIHSMKNVHKSSNKNNGNEGEKSNERSTSPVFPDWPRASYTSRLNGTSQREPVKELILTHNNDRVDEIAESEEDIFGTDDLMVDSDFEAEINNIEKSAAQNTLNTIEIQKSCEASTKKTREEYVENEIVFENINSSAIVKRSSSPFDEAAGSKKKSNRHVSSKNVTEDLSRSARKSFRCELNLDDCEWNNGETKNLFLSTGKQSVFDTVDLADCYWGVERKNIRIPSLAKESVSDNVDLAECKEKIKRSFKPLRKESSTDTVEFTDCDWNIETKKKSISLPANESLLDTVDFTDSFCNSKETKKSISSSTKQSVPDTVDLTDCDWDVEDAKNPTLPTVNQSAPDTVDFNDCCWESGSIKNRTTPPVKESLTDILLDDCDWSSDFECISSPSKPSTSFQKINETRDSPKSISNLLHSTDRIGNRFNIIGNNTSWISTKKPKLSLKLGNKLTKNICKNLLTKQTYTKPATSKEDSDSENEFAVGRLETTITKQLESDFFAKPDPIDKVTRPRPLGMSNPRRIIRGPLMLRRNDVNKLSIKGLSTFAAPNKYTQQQEKRKSLSVGVGRQKSASVDLDTRKKRKKHRVERTRARIRSEFIDDEAEVSSDGNHTSGSSGTDDDLHGFVSYTQHADESVDMQAHYLQTIRSPCKPGAFHIRKPKSPSPGLDIYSQALPDEPNAYLYDSFCVAEDDDVFEDSETPEEISILEEIEISRERKKRKRIQSEDTRGNQKRRVVAPPTDASSSEDEFEKLRRQIHDESFTLRNKSQ